jgi:hypothetical protein
MSQEIRFQRYCKSWFASVRDLPHGLDTKKVENGACLCRRSGLKGFDCRLAYVFWSRWQYHHSMEYCLLWMCVYYRMLQSL